MARRWSKELELVGAGGEPVDLRRTLASHGVADLPPNEDEALSWAAEGAGRMMRSPTVFEDVVKTRVR